MDSPSNESVRSASFDLSERSESRQEIYSNFFFKRLPSIDGKERRGSNPGKWQNEKDALFLKIEVEDYMALKSSRFLFNICIL